MRSLHTNQKDYQEKGGQRSARLVTFPVSCGHAPHYNQHFYLSVYFANSPTREGIATHNATDVCTFPVYTTQGLFNFFPFAVKKKISWFFHTTAHMHMQSLPMILTWVLISAIFAC